MPVGASRAFAWSSGKPGGIHCQPCSRSSDQGRRVHMRCRMRSLLRCRTGQRAASGTPTSSTRGSWATGLCGWICCSRLRLPSRSRWWSGSMAAAGSSALDSTAPGPNRFVGRCSNGALPSRWLSTASAVKPTSQPAFTTSRQPSAGCAGSVRAWASTVLPSECGACPPEDTLRP